MKKIYLSVIVFLTWAMISVAAFAVDVIVVSHGQANDPFLVSCKKWSGFCL